MERGREPAAADPLRRGRRLAVVLLPSLLAVEAGGQKRFELDARTLGDALRALPIRDLVLDEAGALRPLVNVYVDGSDSRSQGGLETPLAPAAEVRVVAAIASG